MMAGPEKQSLQKIDVRHDMDLRTTFAAALGDMKPNQHEEMPGVDAPWSVNSPEPYLPSNAANIVYFRYWEYQKKHNGYTDPFPGLRLHKVNMDPYNAEKPPLERRNLKYYAVRGSMPSIKEDPNMHIAAHLYASDRNSLFVMSVSSFARFLIAADRYN